MKLKQVYYKQNEKFEYKFFNDKECTKKFEFDKRSKNLYIELKNGDITPAVVLDNKCPFGRIDGFILYICGSVTSFAAQALFPCNLMDVNVDYSEYIRKDCVIMCLNIESFEMAYDVFKNHKVLLHLKHSFYSYLNLDEMENQAKMEIENKLEELPKKIMLYTEELTSENLNEINETAKVLKENNVEWVGVFTPFCFVENPPPAWAIIGEDGYFGVMVNGKLKNAYFDKLITTNATGLLEPQKSTYLKVIDCKEIFEGK